MWTYISMNCYYNNGIIQRWLTIWKLHHDYMKLTLMRGNEVETNLAQQSKI